jgi:hypothetical protein
MLKYIGKSLTWILTSGVALAGLGALALSQTAAAEPQWPVLLPPHQDPPPVVPEVNTGLVLLPIALAILLFSSRHLLRRQRLGNR